MNGKASPSHRSPKMYRMSVLARGIQVITFLFAAFGNFLLNIAPPGETDSRYAVGVSSFLMLFVLLFISTVTRRAKGKWIRRGWFIVSAAFFICALVSSLLYQTNLGKLTFPYPPENTRAEQIRGTVYTAAAEEYLKEHPSKTPSEIVAAFGGLAAVEKVWTADSIRAAKMTLTVNYVVVVLSVGVMLFGILEGGISS